METCACVKGIMASVPRFFLLKLFYLIYHHLNTRHIHVALVNTNFNVQIQNLR